jgi:hypothetical protein
MKPPIAVLADPIAPSAQRIYVPFKKKFRSKGLGARLSDRRYGIIEWPAARRGVCLPRDLR